MFQNHERHKNHKHRRSGPNLRKYLYMLMRIILVILQLLVVAAHSDKHGVRDEATAQVS